MKQTQDERLAYLTAYLWNEAHGDNPIVDEGRSKWELYRGLQNVRPPKPIDDAFIQVQDAYLSEINQKHVTYIEDLEPELNQNIYLWQGDITTLAVDGIVNAANSKFLGCMQANHNCIDNIIHTKAGVQLRLACDEIIKKQGKKEGVGKAKITSSYNLPSQYVIHTVGPQVQRKPVSQMNKDLLAKSYRSCLKLADENGLKHLAFCCISTGVFGFPQEEAAKIAIETTLNYLNETNSPIKVIFNVFKDKDFQLYKEALSQHE